MNSGQADATGPQPAPRFGTLEDHALVYAAVVDSALDAVIVVDEAGVVVTLNPAAETTFGYSAAEAIGHEIGALIVPERLKQAHENGMARYRATRVPHVLGRRVEMEARCKNGRHIPVELAITEVNLAGRRLFTANLRDLSVVSAATAEIERQREALHQSEKLAAIGSLLAGVAHELNNPLSIVLGQATMLREEIEAAGGNAATAARAAKIETAAERCARIIRSFLAIARQRKPAKRTVAVATLIDASVELLHYGLQSGGVTVARFDDGSAAEIFADPDQVQQILVNLLVNASQALAEVDGPREIAIRTAAGADGAVRITVSDNGPGVPAEIENRVFDPFFTTKPQGVGTGIGLSISRGLAEAQGGQLVLIAGSQSGATFELSLPRTAGQFVAEADPAPDTAAAPTATPLRRAIVVDDEPEIASLVAEVLQRLGYRCDTASSGREAQALIAAGADGYDAVVCDLRMPDIDGPALYRWIEAHHPPLAGRTLFVTGDALGPAAGRFLAECGRPVLEKPFTPAEIARLVESMPARS